MPAWKPLKRREFVRRLQALGFEGPVRGSRHDFLTHGHNRQTIPSNSEFSVPQLKMLLRQAESILGHRVSLDEWESL